MAQLKLLPSEDLDFAEISGEELPMSPFPETMTTIVTVPPVNTTDRGPQILSPETRPVPDPGDHEILVKVAAAGVNRVDVMQRQGLYAPPPGASEFSGLRSRERSSRWGRSLRGSRSATTSAVSSPAAATPNMRSRMRVAPCRCQKG